MLLLKGRMSKRWVTVRVSLQAADEIKRKVRYALAVRHAVAYI